MPRKKLRSFFSALPQDLRYNIRHKSTDPTTTTTSSSDSTSIGPIVPTHTSHDFLPQFLPTQPEYRPGPSSSSSRSPSPTLTSSHMALPTETASAKPSIGSAVKSVCKEDKWVAVNGNNSDDTHLVKKRKRKGKSGNKNAIVTRVENQYVGHPWDCTGLVDRYISNTDVPKHIEKYWYQRHRLFPAYDDLPLLLDETGWFSITPHAIAANIADRCRSDVILDAFCGVGGNAIEFARTCERVIAMDIDPIRLRLARHNALQLGVADRIEFVLADYVSWAKSHASRPQREEIDVVFLSPPWGGIDYLKSDSPIYPLSAILPIPGDELFALTSQITPNIAYYLPRNVDIEAIGKLAKPLEGGKSVVDDGEEDKVREREWVNVEEEWVGDKLKAVTAYYGGLVDESW